MPLYLTIPLALAALAAAGLICVRLKSEGEEPAGFLFLLGAGSSFTISGATVSAILGAMFDIVPTDEPLFAFDTWHSYALLGAVLALTIFVLVRGILMGIGALLYRWALRLPATSGEPVGAVLATWATSLIGFAVVTALFLSMAHWMDSWGGAALLVAPLIFAAAPLYETLLLPWIRFAKASRMQAPDPATQAWLDDLRQRRGIPRFRIRVARGTEANAYALRGLGGHLVVIGGGLLAGMTGTQIRAVLAHEIAHVIRRDVPKRLLPIAMAGAVGGVLCVMHFSTPLFNMDNVLGLLSGGLVAGLSVATCNMLIPGFFMRKIEFQADRLAVDLLGDGEPMADALRRLGELNDQPLTMWDWSHPSLQKRIDAIEAMPPQTAPA